jgi:hypothetical protein
MGLGPVSLQRHDGGVTLAEARDQCHKLLRQGIDPIEHRLAEHDAQRKSEAERITFKQAAPEFLKVHELGWKNPRHRRAWRNSLASYAFPKLGSRPVSAIDDALINETLAPIWTDRAETASRMGQRIRRIIKWVVDGKPLPTPGKADIVCAVISAGLEPIRVLL